MSVEEAISEYLVESYSGTVNGEPLSLGSNVFIGPESPPSEYVPVNCVFVVQYGADAPVRFFKQFNAINFDLVQVMVRSEQYDYENGAATARGIWGILDRAEITEYDDEQDGYVLAYSVLCEQSAPIYLGRDENGFNIWTINLQVKDVTNTRRELVPVNLTAILPLLFESGIVSMQKVSAELDGYLSSEDWVSFGRRSISGFIEEPEDKTYTLALSASHSGIITDVTTQCVSGSGVATVQVNGVALGGGANAVSSAKTTVEHSASNTVAVGDLVELVISDSADIQDLAFSITIAKG